MRKLRILRGSRPTPTTFNRSSRQAFGLIGLWPFAQAAGVVPELVQNLRSTIVSPVGLGFHPDLGPSTQFLAASTTYATTPAVGIYDLSGSLSIGAWIYPTSTGTYRTIGAHRNNAAGNNGMYTVYLTPANKAEFTIYSGGFHFCTGATTIAANTLNHVMGVYDDANNQVRVYVNGRRDAAAATGASLPSASMAVSWGGYFFGGVNDPFSGLIADARLYTRALSDDEVWQLYAPATRWDLYWTPTGRVSFVKGTTPAAVETAQCIWY